MPIVSRVDGKLLNLAIQREGQEFDDFYVEVVRGYEKPFEYCCVCCPLFSGYGGLYGAQIRIGESHSALAAVVDFFHESKHAQDYKKFKGMSKAEFDVKVDGMPREWQATIYSYWRLVKFLMLG